MNDVLAEFKVALRATMGDHDWNSAHWDDGPSLAACTLASGHEADPAGLLVDICLGAPARILVESLGRPWDNRADRGAKLQAIVAVAADARVRAEAWSTLAAARWLHGVEPAVRSGAKEQIEAACMALAPQSYLWQRGREVVEDVLHADARCAADDILTDIADTLAAIKEAIAADGVESARLCAQALAATARAIGGWQYTLHTTRDSAFAYTLAEDVARAIALGEVSQ